MLILLKNKKIHHEKARIIHAYDSWWIKFLTGLAKNSIYFYFLFNITIEFKYQNHHAYSSNLVV